MKILIITFGLVVTLVGLAGIIAPQQFRRVPGNRSLPLPRQFDKAR